MWVNSSRAGTFCEDMNRDMEVFLDKKGKRKGV